MSEDFSKHTTREIAESAHAKADFILPRAADTAALASVLYRILVQVVRQHPTNLESVSAHFMAQEPETADASLTMLAQFMADVHSASD